MFFFILFKLFSLYQEIIHEQLLLKRMADVAIHLYAMTAVLSRATSSANKGNETAEDEVCLQEF